MGILENDKVKIAKRPIPIKFSTLYSEEEKEYAKSKNVELEVIPIVNEAFVFYVNSKNKVKSLTLEQIQDIYSGKITNWKEIGGLDRKIEAFQKPENSEKSC